MAVGRGGIAASPTPANPRGIGRPSGSLSSRRGRILAVVVTHSCVFIAFPVQRGFRHPTPISSSSSSSLYSFKNTADNKIWKYNCRTGQPRHRSTHRCPRPVFKMLFGSPFQNSCLSFFCCVLLIQIHKQETSRLFEPCASE